MDNLMHSIDNLKAEIDSLKEEKFNEINIVVKAHMKKTK